MVEFPVKALVQITKLQHYLIILSSFILFFSIIPVWESGLDRHNLLMGAIFFFVSSMVFWLCSIAVELGSEEKLQKSDFALTMGIILFVVWLVFIIIAFYFFVNSVVYKV